LRLMGFLLVPITVGMIVLRYPIVGLLFERGKFTQADTARTAWAFMFLILGLYVYAGRDTFTRVFYSYHDTRTPVKISVATVFINIGLSYLFMQFMGVGGLALGTTVALTLNFVVLMGLLRRKIGTLGLTKSLRSLVHVLALSLVMGLAVWLVDLALAHGLTPGLQANALRVVIGGVVGLALFLAGARLTKMPELAEITDMLRAVFRRSRQEKVA
ncbi:MAG: polysaccharide biosynthesis C-terminal domain-containing protein, partial [Thermoleophilia bacterium]|nr:polysaccharide biosynthesis C-terminal domain-containing protein [Thermoleophilia bacterium]